MKAPHLKLETKMTSTIDKQDGIYNSNFTQILKAMVTPPSESAFKNLERDFSSSPDIKLFQSPIGKHIIQKTEDYEDYRFCVLAMELCQK
jgi:hypothetical protein